MSFVRAKEIPPRSGNWYDYEVECIWNNGHPRQKVLHYLGRSDVARSFALSRITPRATRITPPRPRISGGGKMPRISRSIDMGAGIVRDRRGRHIRLD